MINRNNNRKQPNLEAKNLILATQKGRCFWCGRRFNTMVIKPDNTTYILTPHWDHYIPYIYTNNSYSDNFVAACIRCNSHKNSFIVTSSKEELKLRNRLKRKWYHGGWRDIEKYNRMGKIERCVNNIEEIIEEEIEVSETIPEINPKLTEYYNKIFVVNNPPKNKYYKIDPNGKLAMRRNKQKQKRKLDEERYIYNMRRKLIK
jgi:hypothetical protein